MRGFARALVITALAAGSGASQAAPDVTFNFNSLNAGATSTANGGGAQNITQYMTSVYGSSVTVDAGALAQKVRPGSNNPPSGWFLGNTDGATTNGAYVANTGPAAGHTCPAVGTNSDANNNCGTGGTQAYDTFLINQWQNTNLASNVRDRVKFTFVSNAIFGLSVDWEIFPQTTVPSDIQIFANGVNIFEVDLTTSAQTQAGAIGHFDLLPNDARFNSGGIFASGISTLEVVDWTTAPIGIDNLGIYKKRPPQQTPEPASLALMGLALAGLAAIRRRRSA